MNRFAFSRRPSGMSLLGQAGYKKLMIPAAVLVVV
jgi:hypothetical protein